MATLTVYAALNLATLSVWSGSTQSASSSLIALSSGSRFGYYTGSSFGYSSSGELVSGTLTGYSEAIAGSTQYRVTGISVPAAYAASLINSNQLPLMFATALAGSDTLYSSPYTDHLIGYGGNDLFYASSGNDIFDGGDGTDTVSYSGNRSAYTVTAITNAWQVQKPSASGTDTVYNNVERISFADGTLGLDTVSGSSGVMYRLYKAAFDRVPDTPGLGHNIPLMDGGLTLAQMSDAFVVSAEFTNTYGALSNAQFVNQLYANVFDRTPDAPGLAWNLNLLNTTLTRAAMLSGFSESAENQAAVIGQIQDGIWFT